MNARERIIYGVIVALVVFFVGQVVLAVGSVLVNIFFAIAMGLFAIFAVSIAARITGKHKR